MVDRTPQPCTHPRADHQHGTRACYVHDKCRCHPCRAANSTYASEHNRQKLYGRTNLVDAEPARQHVRQLLASGMGWKTVAKSAGVGTSVMTKLLYGKRRADGSRVPTQRLRPETRHRLLEVKLELADHAHIASIGATRRIRALMALGWSQTKLAERLGVTPSNFTHLPAGSRPYILAATARAVIQLYDELSMTRPPEATHRDRIAASRSRGYAKARRWVPPLAWDDEDLDNPTAHPRMRATA